MDAVSKAQDNLEEYRKIWRSSTFERCPLRGGVERVCVRKRKQKEYCLHLKSRDICQDIIRVFREKFGLEIDYEQALYCWEFITCDRTVAAPDIMLTRMMDFAEMWKMSEREGEIKDEFAECKHF